MQRSFITSVLALVVASWGVLVLRDLHRFAEVPEAMSRRHVLTGTLVRPLLAFFRWSCCDMNEEFYRNRVFGDMNGLKNEAIVRRDKFGVPHINATDMEDALFVEGFMHATGPSLCMKPISADRTWQLEAMRLVALGRLAAVVGVDGLPIDRVMRALALDKTNTTIAKPYAQYLTTYVRGINAGLEAVRTGGTRRGKFVIKLRQWIGRVFEGRKLPDPENTASSDSSAASLQPLEAFLLNHDILPTWKETDSIAIMRLIALVMNRGWTIEVGDAILKKTLPREVYELFSRSNGFPGATPVNAFGGNATLFHPNGARIVTAPETTHRNDHSRWSKSRPSPASPDARRLHQKSPLRSEPFSTYPLGFGQVNSTWADLVITDA